MPQETIFLQTVANSMLQPKGAPSAIVHDMKRLYEIIDGMIDEMDDKKNRQNVKKKSHFGKFWLLNSKCKI